MRKSQQQQPTKPDVVYEPPPGQEGYGYSLLKPSAEPWKEVDLHVYAVPIEEPKLDEPEGVV